MISVSLKFQVVCQGLQYFPFVKLMFKTSKFFMLLPTFVTVFLFFYFTVVSVTGHQLEIWKLEIEFYSSLAYVSSLEKEVFKLVFEMVIVFSCTLFEVLGCE